MNFGVTQHPDSTTIRSLVVGASASIYTVKEMSASSNQMLLCGPLTGDLKRLSNSNPPLLTSQRDEM